jgi:hypothetical protein
MLVALLEQYQVAVMLLAVAVAMEEVAVMVLAVLEELMILQAPMSHMLLAEYQLQMLQQRQTLVMVEIQMVPALMLEHQE